MEAMEKDVEWELDRRFKDIFRQDVERKVQEAKYNQRYKNIRSEKIPKYLMNCKKGIQIDIIARIRCGNLEERCKYWLADRQKSCILCGKSEGSLEHLIEGCTETKGWVNEIPGVNCGAKIRVVTSEIGDRIVCKIFRKIDQAKESKKGVENRN
ncbi:hypothetical protein QAD02_013836 [Eretmocerus hayati]|uniref:Uncharacterized protein n=1 Tax=Eretmocerus hayati TaxID=131215 RepID=A0ACC2P669_9HYME|nr:hypothetical protein QAD02_013836 [Eretmocerus hayati]